MFIDTTSSYISKMPDQSGHEGEGVAKKLSALAGANGNDRASLHRAASEFEGYFVAYLMKVMRETVPTGLFENKHGQQFYYFYDQEIGRLAAERGGLGFGAQLLEQYDQQHQGLTKSEKNPLKFSSDPADKGVEPVNSKEAPQGQQRSGMTSPVLRG